MNNEEWVKSQEQSFSGRFFGVSEKEYKMRPDHYLKAVRKDTGWRRNGSILCLGCNDGTHVNTFYFEGMNAYGCDLPKVIERARYRYPRIVNRLIPVDINNDALPNKGKWDVIFAKSIIEHLPQYKSLPTKMYDVQKENGYVWLSTRNGDVDSYVEENHFVHLGWNELEELFTDVGYEIENHYTDPLSEKAQILVAKV